MASQSSNSVPLVPGLIACNLMRLLALSAPFLREFFVDTYIHTGYTHHVSSREIVIEDLLPLPEATFHILMAVAEDDRHGYAIIQEVAARTDGRLKLSPGTLYRSIQRMLEQGLIE